jgi:prepilin-type N-terminal cleavage/methylation domain-containing protein
MNKGNSSTASGFTIVELLVVIVVIGILAAITIVSFSGITQRATVASLQSDLESASKLLKLDQISSDDESYPATLALANGGRGITSNSNDLSYAVNNNTNPKGFCVASKQGTTSYKITNDGAITVGDCLSWGLIGHWTMDEGSGTSVVDSSSLGRNGTWSGTGTHYVAGKIGAYAGQFSSLTSDFVNISPVPAYTNPTEVSYSFWNIPTATSGDHAIIHFAGQLCQSITTQIRCWVNTSNQSVSYARAASGSWEHVVVTISFVTNTVKTYTDGQLRQTDAITVTRNTGSWTSMYIGQYGGSRRFDGQIDDVRVYSRILSDSDIQALYNL